MSRLPRRTCLAWMAGAALPLRAQPAAAGVTAFVDVRLLPMDERPRLLEGQTLLVRAGRIEAIGPGLPVPEGALRIEGQGRLCLSPALADMHMHSDSAEDMAVYLSHGVTTALNMGGARSRFLQRTLPALNEGRLPGPRVHAAFTVDGVPDHGHFQLRTPAQAEALVELAQLNGYRFIKAYNGLAPEVFAALAQACRRRGLPLLGHGVSRVRLARQLEAGQVLVAHLEEFFYTFFAAPGEAQTDTPPDDARIPAAVALLRAHPGAAVVADLVTYEAIAAQIGRPERLAEWLADPAAATLAPADRLAWRASPYVAKNARLQARLAFLGRLARALAEAGVPLLAGTDSPTIAGLFPGLSLHRNLRLLERAGLSRWQALASATREPGLFLSRQLGEPPAGQLLPGARADLILSEASPLDDLSTLERPLGVMAGGRWFDAAALAALRRGVAERYRAVAA
ncbi:amidohydrolase [Roseateles sp. DAIF2]|uniref:amidohydrolase family protein n=1 Tax=Roseateles sp. DAIF2 TaxID=2714952 RepID=UPI0018A285FB|nr:amidohydrolase [Roseateles sp. DAIF2]QPF75919.1 amidohydrolase [Roseateles sp. DAIF2]